MSVFLLRVIFSKHTNYSPLWFIILLSLSFFHSEAQTENLDSLKARVLVTDNPAEKYRLLDDITWESKDDYPKQAIDYARQMLTLDKPDWRATAFNRMGLALNTLRQYDEALTYYDSALIIENSLKRPYGLGRVKNQKANVLIKLQNFERAKDQAQAAVYHLRQSNKPRALATALGVLGYIYTDLLEFDSSYYYITQSEELSEQLGQKMEVYRSKLNLSRLYLRRNNFERSLSYSRQTIAYIDSSGLNKKLHAKAYTNMGLAYYKMWQLDKAEEYQFKALAINEQANDEEATSKNLGNLGNIYQAKKEYQKAETYLKRSRDLKVKIGDRNAFVTDINLGNLYLDLDKPSKALNSFLQALQWADSLNRLKSYPEVLRGLSRSYDQLGRSKEALTYQNRFIAIKDEIEMDRIRATNLENDLLNERNRTAILKAQNENQALKNDKQRLTIYSLIGGVLLIVILFFTILKLSQLRNKNRLIKKNEQIHQQQIEQLIKQKEVDAISAMIEGQESERLRIARDLHDRLGGTLSIVKVHFKSVEESLEALKETTIKQYRDANVLLDEACDEVRKIAHDMTSGVLMKFGLVKALEELKATVDATRQLTINLIDIGMDERLTYDYEINIYRIIQELITNALKHAKATEMNIQVFRKDDRLSIVVEDNGQGFSLNEALQKGGIGLKNIEGRVNKLEGEINIDSGLGSGTTITIDIPIKEENV